MYSFTRKALVNGKQFQHGDDASKLPKHLIERFLLAGMVIKTSVKPVEDSVKPVEDSVKPVEDSVKPVEDSVKPVEDSVKPVEDSVKPVVVKSEKGWDVVLNDSVLSSFKTKKEATAFAEVL